MKQRQSMGGVGLLILMLLVIMFFSLKVPGMATERELSYPEFMVYLENKTVESAQIRPNREVPTGEVIFETTSGDREEFNVLDVKEVEMALRKAGEALGNYRLNNCILVVTLEPCAMCAAALVHARVDGVVFGAADAVSGALLSCDDILSRPYLNHRVWHMGGIRAEECAALLHAFFAVRRTP